MVKIRICSPNIFRFELFSFRKFILFGYPIFQTALGSQVRKFIKLSSRKSGEIFRDIIAILEMGRVVEGYITITIPNLYF